VKAGVTSGMKGRRRWWVIGGVLGAIAVSGGLVAVLGGTSGDADEPGGQVEGTLDGERVEWRHEFPEAHAGDVWITVEAADESPRTVTITWGEWQRRLSHDASGRQTYVFTKNPGPTVETVVRAEPAAVVTFGTGTPPAEAEDVNAGWTRVVT
jgi:hypothetical protein